MAGRGLSRLEKLQGVHADLHIAHGPLGIEVQPTDVLGVHFFPDKAGQRHLHREVAMRGQLHVEAQALARCDPGVRDEQRQALLRGRGVGQGEEQPVMAAPVLRAPGWPRPPAIPPCPASTVEFAGRGRSCRRWRSASRMTGKLRLVVRPSSCQSPVSASVSKSNSMVPAQSEALNNQVSPATTITLHCIEVTLC